MLDLGRLFFRHSQPNAVLTGIDRSLYDQFREGGPEDREASGDFIAIEVHCRRSGSHFGHIISLDGTILPA